MDDATFQKKLNHVSKLMRELNDECQRRYGQGMLIDADSGTPLAMRKEPTQTLGNLSSQQRQSYVEFQGSYTGWSSVVW